MIRYASVALISILVICGAFAQEPPGTNLRRPDPGVGAGFASAMEKQFKTAFGLNDDEAKCLVYEVVAWVNETKAYDLSPTQIAGKTASRCGLNLTARGK